ncbi:MAG: proliferating cell nuclear antigen (pcna) [Candidatus Nitrosocosmicus sp.]|jgi:proliferating cell nuclear antigen|uniref:proliferating cell nuclear antigen (pcna) n=1 Tax=Candidatus Nitrosocosmicus agrestis TaxID=2563600 RepID=UPI001E49D2FE|nr:proliferating cell nuclear antigen (pcna) [Candidatus Nitrosocosmicus sp. SS]MDR4491928.1 proliferating cell nuclear antigen (pcna) [Candidatus Nitrosocosmicus sp.]HET6590487.1 proliferating cell nuclear antigen (pcna) [Candidatus Nitrosocosmicus sp.]
MFTAKTKSPEEWKIINSAISTLVDEATFEATSEGISFRGMDPSHVALIDIFWPNTAFDSYQCDSELKFGVRISEFSKLIKRTDKKDELEVSITDQDVLRIRTSGSYKREYKMRLIESSSGSTPLPKLSFNSKLVLSLSAFDKILSDIEVVSEYVEIESFPERIEFLGKSDTGEAMVTMEPNSEGLEDIEVKEESKATYSLDYLLKIVKSVSSVGVTSAIEYSTKMPIRLEFRIANIGRIHFYLAPRVQD